MGIERPPFLDENKIYFSSRGYLMLSTLPTSKPASIDFFISYNRHDLSWAQWIGWVLEDAGYTTVIQAWDFKAGGNFVLDMHQAAITARCTLAVLSDTYLKSAFTAPEWAAAFAQAPTGAQRKLIPVRVQECQPNGLLEPIIYVDLVGVAEAEAEVMLLQAVSRDRAKPSQKPRFPGQDDRPKPLFPPMMNGMLESPGLIIQPQKEGGCQGCVPGAGSKSADAVRRVTVRDSNSEVELEITLEGDFAVEVRAGFSGKIEVCMKNSSGDSIRITGMRPGSIKITVQGSPQDIARLIEKIRSRELAEMEGLPILGFRRLDHNESVDANQRVNQEYKESTDEITDFGSEVTHQNRFGECVFGENPSGQGVSTLSPYSSAAIHQKSHSQVWKQFSDDYVELLQPGNPIGVSMEAFLRRTLSVFHLLGFHSEMEVLSEVYLRASCLIHEQGTTIDTPSAWVRKTAHNVIREWSRKRQRSTALDWEVIDEREENHSHRLALENDLAILDKAWQSLTAKEQRLLTLKIDQNLSWPEIGAIYAMDGNPITEAALRQNKARILKKLRRLYHTLSPLTDI
jgi:RNA polymerase sigma factor (sigma-70 family)